MKKIEFLLWSLDYMQYVILQIQNRIKNRKEYEKIRKNRKKRKYN